MPSVIDHPRKLVRFAGFELDPVSGELRHGENTVRLQPQPLKLLLALLQRPGELVTRDELKQELMPDAAYGDFDHAINLAVSKLRAALNDPPDSPELIETLPRRGYRFVGKVEAVGGPSGANVSAAPAPRPQVRRWHLWAVGALLVILAGVGTYYYVRHRHQQAFALTEKDTVVLADFTNQTSDPVLTGALQQALSIQLSQSPFLNIVSDRRVRSVLRQMGRQSGDRAVDEVAREVCIRTGSKVYVAGSIASVGNEYVVGLKAFNCAIGETVFQEQAEVQAKEDLLTTVAKQAAVLRYALGESLGSIKKFDLYQLASTSSLEALEAYSQSWKVYGEKGELASIPYLKHAVELDPNFATAYARLAGMYANLGQTEQAEECSRKAYELRERIGGAERFYVEGHYYMDVTGEWEKALQLYEVYKNSIPKAAVPYTNSGVIYQGLGQYEKALAEFEAVFPRFRAAPFANGNLALVYMQLGRMDDAARVLTEAEARKVKGGGSLLQLQYLLAFVHNDEAAMARALAAAPGEAEPERSLSVVLADTAAWKGQMRQARELSQQAADSARRNDLAGVASLDLAQAAVREAIVGNGHEARRLAEKAVGVSRGRNILEISALALTQAGYTEQAQALVEELERKYPVATMLQVYWLPTIRASMELQRNNPVAAVEFLTTARPLELGTDFQAGSLTLMPVYVRGLAYLQSRQGDEAATEFQKILDHPGIVLNNSIGAVGRLGLARAYSLKGDTAKARAEYETFLTLWKDADPDVPIYRQAKAEYAKLRAN